MSGSELCARVSSIRLPLDRREKNKRPPRRSVCVQQPYQGLPVRYRFCSDPADAIQQSAESSMPAHIVLPDRWSLIRQKEVLTFVDCKQSMVFIL